VPRFVLQELQLIADSGTSSNATAADAGSTSSRMQLNEKIDVKIMDVHRRSRGAKRSVDEMLVELAVKSAGEWSQTTIT